MPDMTRKKVLMGMSGGVDSSVAASLLLSRGYEVTGVFIEAYNEPGCRTDQDKKDALQVAIKLGIPFSVLDLRAEYKSRVVQYFLDEYEAGRTPNPDIVCNREVKFGLLYDYMEANGYDYLATGHYARITKLNNKSVLQRPLDLSKDQTYFLWQVKAENLEKIIFPLGDKLKSEVREIAKKLELPNSDKPDSMGVCMMGELNVREFLRNKLGVKPGEVKWKGQIVGSHEGLWFHTIGERGGWKIYTRYENQKSKIDMTNLPPLYVIGKDRENNLLFVGERSEAMTSKFKIANLESSNVNKLWVRIRNLGELISVKKLSDDTVELNDDIFAPAPGQSAVFYDESGRVVGGGTIAN